MGLGLFSLVGTKKSGTNRKLKCFVGFELLAYSNRLKHPAKMASSDEAVFSDSESENSASAASALVDLPFERVEVSRTQPRHKLTGEICFDITFPGEEEPTRFPIHVLMDNNDHTFAHQEVSDAINHWIAVAQKFPHRNRKCICCRHRAQRGAVLCSHCDEKFGETVYAK